MAQLLFRIRDKSHEDFEKDVKFLKRGDVVMVVSDEHNFGMQELLNPDWRVLKFPFVSVNDASYLVSPEIPDFVVTNESDPSFKALQVRGFRLNLDKDTLPFVMKDYLADDERTIPSYEVPSTIKLNDLVAKKEKRIHPKYLG